MNSSALTVIGSILALLTGLDHEGHFACAVSVHFDFANPMIANATRNTYGAKYRSDCLPSPTAWLLTTHGCCQTALSIWPSKPHCCIMSLNFALKIFDRASTDTK